jgi:Ca2+-binding RTX toxin-like protein
VVQGTGNADTLKSYSQVGEKVTIYGNGGNDTSFGGNGEDVFVGGPGSDAVYTRSNSEGGGMKTFVWNIGDGHDNIWYYNEKHTEGDGQGVLRFGAGIDVEDVEVRVNGGGNTVFALRDGSGSVTFEYTARVGVAYQLDAIQFADGTVWSWQDVRLQKVVQGTENADTLKSYSKVGEKVTIYGNGGNDTSFGGNGEDVFVGGLGSDAVYTRSNSEGGGMKTFVWNVGDGHDHVWYYNEAHIVGDGQGVLRFGADIDAEDVEVRVSGGNTVFALRDGSGSVTFEYTARVGLAYQLDEIQFADGTIWSWQDAVLQEVVRGTENADTLKSYSKVGEKVTIYGNGGNDTSFGGIGEDVFVGGTGSDAVYARSNSEGGGMKTFVWNVGDGHDHVWYYNEAHTVGDGQGVLRFGVGIDVEDVEVRVNGSGRTVFALRDGSGSVTFEYTDRVGLAYQLDEIQFADGTVWSWSTMPRQ